MKLYLLLSLFFIAEAFPRSNVGLEAHIVASSAGNLPSASYDAIAIGTTFQRRGFKLHFYLDVTQQQLSKITKTFPTATYHANLDDLKGFDRENYTPTDYLITVSSHAYKGRSGTYIQFKGVTYPATNIAQWITPLSSQDRVLMLIDTCHSGNFLNLPHVDSEMKNAIVCTISACSSHQMNSDDISTKYGFGGGLTTSVLDYISTIDDKDEIKVHDLYSYCHKRLRCAGVNPQMCWL